MALNIKDSETERLATEVAIHAGETKTRAICIALQERLMRLLAEQGAAAKAERIRRFLIDEAWPQMPAEALGTPLSKGQREQILGYGSVGV
ncbi:MAG: type II toxin-antitoxin system VapB family antitoxin [Micrococcales bacterium]|nr:type II toxin-antitoxin system VapB family antitoxin [Micrococcales bacterium]